MKVSVNWIKEFTGFEIPVSELVQKIGAQLGAVETVEDLANKYKGIIVSKVVSCEKHPNADRLNVCLIDDGGKATGVARNENGLVQVVCGAPNAREGLTVAWLPPGSTVPSSYLKDPFVLEARELRGVVSNGMLASSQELDISDDHNGIVELSEVAPGTDFANMIGFNDSVIEIENKMFTHRPDCFGLLGVAREVSGINQKQFKSPDWYTNFPTFNEVGDELPLSVQNNLPELVPRFMAVTMSSVGIKPSPIELQAQMKKVGLKPINNVVDVTNYLMYLTGQPLHAFDYDKVAERSNNGAVLAVRHPSQGEKLALLNGKTIEPRPEAILITTDKMAIGVGGVMGGSDTEVDENTKNIIIECANFDMYSVRRTSMAHGLFTDAVTRFNKGQSPVQNSVVLAKAMEMMSQNAGAKQAGNVIDQNSINAESHWLPIDTTTTFINSRLGLNLETDQIKNLLENVEFKVDINDQKLSVAAPFWRTDLSIQEDVVEEVGRLFGYDKLPFELPKRSTVPTQVNEDLQFKSEIRNKLASFGANEVLTYSFVHGNLLERCGQNKDSAFKIANALSPELQYYRLSLTPSLLSLVHGNVKAGFDKFALFEINKTHSKLHSNDDDGVPKEYEMLSLVFADTSSKVGPAYYHAKTYLDELAKSVGISIEYKPVEKDVDYAVVKPFEIGRSALAYAQGSNIALGIVGEYKASVRKKLKLPAGTAGFEIGLLELLAAKSGESKYVPLSRFPSINQDICLQVANTLNYGNLTDLFSSSLENYSSEVATVTFEPIDIYSSENLGDKKRITYRVKLTSYERTLTEEVLTGILDKVAADLSEKVSAERI